MLGTGYTTTCIIIKLVNSLIQVAINFLERHMDTYGIRVILFLGIQFRTGYQNQAKSSLEQGQVSGGPAAHPPPPRGPESSLFTQSTLMI